MKLLLDENLPHQMRNELIGHEVFTTAYMNWVGVENGELLKLAAEHQFDAVLTNDHGIEYEQNIDSLPVAVIVLMVESNTIEKIRPLYNAIHSAINNLRPCELVKIDSP